MISASISTLGLNNLKILGSKITKNDKNFLIMFCEFPHCSVIDFFVQFEEKKRESEKKTANNKGRYVLLCAVFSNLKQLFVE